ncbi:MAG: hypothetical protein ACTSQJ_06920 [Promethearchaeota archaeon]
MKLLYFIRSSTIELSKYTIKDIPGSSGRLDVISRCILSALLGFKKFEKETQIWVFLDNYGTYIFDSEKLNYDSFPKNELLLTNYFVEIIRKRKSKINLENNPLSSVIISNINIINAIKQYQKLKYAIYILIETGLDFFAKINELKEKSNLVFIIGNQCGDFLSSDEIKSLNLENLSFGNQSYLASSIIRLLKIYLLSLV